MKKNSKYVILFIIAIVVIILMNIGHICLAKDKNVLEDQNNILISQSNYNQDYDYDYVDIDVFEEYGYRGKKELDVIYGKMLFESSEDSKTLWPKKIYLCSEYDESKILFTIDSKCEVVNQYNNQTTDLYIRRVGCYENFLITFYNNSSTCINEGDLYITKIDIYDTNGTNEFDKVNSLIVYDIADLYDIANKETYNYAYNNSGYIVNLGFNNLEDVITTNSRINKLYDKTKNINNYGLISTKYSLDLWSTADIDALKEDIYNCADIVKINYEIGKKPLTINFNTKNGTSILSQYKYIFDNCGNYRINEINVPKKDGYYFLFWELDGKEVNFNDFDISKYSNCDTITLNAIYAKKQNSSKYDMCKYEICEDAGIILYYIGSYDNGWLYSIEFYNMKDEKVNTVNGKISDINCIEIVKDSTGKNKYGKLSFYNYEIASGNQIRKIYDFTKNVNNYSLLQVHYTASVDKLFEGESIDLIKEQNEIDYNTGLLIKTTGIKGDVNYDGEINAFDYLMLKAYIINDTTNIDIDLKMGDLNNDNKIDVFDYLILKSYILE